MRNKDLDKRRLLWALILLLAVVSAGALLIIIFGDISVSGSMRNFAVHRPAVMKAARYLTEHGNKIYHFFFLMLLIFGLVGKKKKFLRIVLIYIIVQAIATGFITEGLKFAVGRPRPGHGFEHELFTLRCSFRSFPSGHTADAFSSAGVLWFFMPSYLSALGFFVYSLGIGLSRIFVGAHYLLDVLAGISFGFLTGLIITHKKYKSIDE
jgi:undecaprenyl-diphosphatase